MPAFDELIWSQFDVWAAVACEGVAVVDTAMREPCRDWLRRHGYGLTTLDFSGGISPAVAELGDYLGWMSQFGYELSAESRNLNALRDGFNFRLGRGQRHTIEVVAAEFAHHEDPQWLAGLLAISREYSRCQLALGSRFFATLYLDRQSPLIGWTYATLGVPNPFWTAARDGSPFASASP